MSHDQLRVKGHVKVDMTEDMISTQKNTYDILTMCVSKNAYQVYM